MNKDKPVWDKKTSDMINDTKRLGEELLNKVNKLNQERELEMCETKLYEVQLFINNNFSTRRNVDAENEEEAVKKAVTKTINSWVPDRPEFKVCIDVFSVVEKK